MNLDLLNEKAENAQILVDLFVALLLLQLHMLLSFRSLIEQQLRFDNSCTVSILCCLPI